MESERLLLEWMASRFRGGRVMGARLRLVLFLALMLSGGAVFAEEGADYVAAVCTTCHGEDLVHQQRLTEAQWTSTVDKMVSWGAQADDADMKKTLVSYLSKNFGPDAGPFVLRRVTPYAARMALAPLPDGPYRGGDATKGKKLYDEACAGCHGPTARGELGMNLVDRFFLYRAPDFASIVREGQGEMMPGRPMDDAGVADVLAYLRELPG